MTSKHIRPLWHGDWCLTSFGAVKRSLRPLSFELAAMTSLHIVRIIKHQCPRRCRPCFVGSDGGLHHQVMDNNDVASRNHVEL